MGFQLIRSVYDGCFFRRKIRGNDFAISGTSGTKYSPTRPTMMFSAKRSKSHTTSKTAFYTFVGDPRCRSTWAYSYIRLLCMSIHHHGHRHRHLVGCTVSKYCKKSILSILSILRFSNYPILSQTVYTLYRLSS